jgi:predicted  nucleic acid-binding Zn-ribbon protein
MATRMQQRRGTASQWTTANPVLAAGEIGFETDTGKFKIGDGTNTWSLLKYFLNLDALDIDGDGFVTDAKVGVADGVASLNSEGFVPPSQMPDAYLTTKISTQLADIVGSAPDALNTLNEIAAAFNNDPGYADTVTAALGLKAPINNPTFTGSVVVPQEPVSDVSGRAASTSHVTEKVGAAKTLLEAAISETNTNVETLNTMVTVTIEGRLDGIDSSITSAESSLGTLDSRVSATESDISALESDVSTLNSVTSATDSSVSTLQTQVNGLDTALSARIDATESDITTLTTSTGALDTRLDNAETSITTLQSGTASLETDLDALSTRVTTAEADIVALETQTGNSDDHIAASLNVHGIANTADLATKSYADNAKTDAISTSATAIALKADIDSPALTGTPTAPTATAGTDTTQIATTAFVQDAIESVIGAAPAALDTLNELAAAINDDASYAATITSELALKAPKADPTFTGTVALPAASSVTLDGTALSATLATKADNNSVINTMSGSHTIATADVNNIREMSGGGTLSIPADNSFWPVGAVVDVIQTGSSQVTIAGGSGVTVNATPGLKLRAQWSSATILKRAANTFVVMGDLSA